MKYSINDGFPYYIELLGDKDYNQLFTSKENLDLLRSVTEENAASRYAPGKWSIKQIIGHITDHERIMTYRALRFSRKDKTALPGYDQDTFVDNSRFDEQPVSQLITDLENVRNASISFIRSLSKEQLLLTGTAWKYELTVEEFLKATIGHELHHIEVIKQKYLPTFIS
ncbi:MAG TPA: DinB family protein [Niastella sp.]